MTSKTNIQNTFETRICGNRIQFELWEVWSVGNHKFHYESRHVINDNLVNSSFLGYDLEVAERKFFHQRHTYKVLKDAGL